MNTFWPVGAVIVTMAISFVSAPDSAADIECSRDGIRSSMMEKRASFLAFLEGGDDPESVLEKYRSEFEALRERYDYESIYAELESLEENPEQQPSPELCERVQESGKVVDSFINSHSD